MVKDTRDPKNPGDAEEPPCFKFPDIAKNEALYRALIYVLKDRFRLDKGRKPDEKLFPATTTALQSIRVNNGTAEDEANRNVLRLVVSAFGLLDNDTYRDPVFGKDTGEQDLKTTEKGAETTSLPGHHVRSPDVIEGDLQDGGRKVYFVPRFVDLVTRAVGEYEARRGMFDEVFNTLGKKTKNWTILASQVAEVGRRLIDAGRDEKDAQIGERIENVLSIVLRDGIEGRASAIDVDLPDLDDNTTADILANNVNALAAIYFAAQLEELKLFATADKVLEHFMSGMLPLTRGPGGDAIYEHFKSAPNRLTEMERRSLYARSFGFAQGSVDEPLPNREFQDSWIRFLSAVSQYVRFCSPESSSRVVYQGPIITIEQVFKSAKDLAVNLSLHGYGIAHFAAVELQDLVRKVKAMLSSAEVLQAYGVLDVWQLVERVSQLYLGGSVNGVQKRTMANAGANIIQWLAKNAPVLSAASADSVVLLDLIFHPKTAPSNVAHPDKFDDIANNVERWLAVTGTVEAAVEKYAEPVAMPAQATIPNMSLQAAVPEALRGVLSQVGGGLPALSNLSGNSIGKA
jgi:hypothetical protein